MARPGRRIAPPRPSWFPACGVAVSGEDSQPLSWEFICSSASAARSATSPPCAIALKRSSRTSEPSTLAQPGAAGVSLAFEAADLLGEGVGAPGLRVLDEALDPARRRHHADLTRAERGPRVRLVAVLG